MTSDPFLCPNCRVTLVGEPAKEFRRDEVNVMRCPACSTRYTLVPTDQAWNDNRATGGPGHTFFMTIVYLLAIIGLIAAVIFGGCALSMGRF